MSKYSCRKKTLQRVILNITNGFITSGYLYHEHTGNSSFKNPGDEQYSPKSAHPFPSSISSEPNNISSSSTNNTYYHSTKIIGNNQTWSSMGATNVPILYEYQGYYFTSYSNAS